MKNQLPISRILSALGFVFFLSVPFVISPGGGFLFLPHLDPYNLPSSYGFGINSSGIVVGESSSQNIEKTAFRWTTALGIGTLAGNSAPASSAKAVTDTGGIAGTAVFDDGQGGYVQKPFYWFQGSPMTTIELLPGMILGDGYSLNTRDFVVGRNALEVGTVCIDPGFPPDPICYSDTATDRAYIWSSVTGTNQLDTMIDPADPLYGSLQLSSAWGISSNGYIAANGYISGQTGQHAFLLIPDLFFADGFERGDTGAWSGTTP